MIVRIKSVEPPVSVIIPYKEGKPFNKIVVCENDEVIIVRGGKSIGHARIHGTKVSKNDWIIQIDSDAIYPKDYILKAKYFIRKYGTPVMCATRLGGLRNIFTPCYEHGLIARKDVFLSRVKDYNGHDRDDIAQYFYDAKRIPVYYYHGFTQLERNNLAIISLFTFMCL